MQLQSYDDREPLNNVTYMTFHRLILRFSQVFLAILVLSEPCRGQAIDDMTSSTLALFIRSSVIEAFKVPSESMKPTLIKGDHFFVNKLSYGLQIPFSSKAPFQWGTPDRGDIVVFTRPDDPKTAENESQIKIIKRVIAIGGDTVEVRDKKVFIDQKEVVEPYAFWDEENLVDGNFGPQKVPEGKLFLLGDNRNHSRDSRFWPHPFIDVSRVKGRAGWIYYSGFNFARVGTQIK